MRKIIFILLLAGNIFSYNLIAADRVSVDCQQWQKKFDYFVSNKCFSTLSHWEDEEFIDTLNITRKKLEIPEDIECTFRGEQEKELIEQILHEIESLEVYAQDSKKRSDNKESYKKIRSILLEKIYDFILYRVYEGKSFLGMLHGESFKDARIKQEQIITDFLGRRDIKHTLSLIYGVCPVLRGKQLDPLSKFIRPQVGPFSNFDVPFISVGGSPYLSYLIKLVPHIAYIADWEDLKDQLSATKSSMLKIKVFQTEAVNLARIYQIILDISRIPGKDVQFKDDIYEYLKKELGFLGMGVDRFIPHDFRKILPSVVAEARKKVLSVDLQEALESQKIILHSLIPWKSLISLGNLIHQREKEGISQSLIILKSASPALLEEFVLLKPLVFNLLQTLLGSKIDVPPEDFPCFQNIRCMAGHHADKSYLAKLISTLKSFADEEQLKQVRDHPAGNLCIRYGALRALVSLGEASKEMLFLSAPQGKSFQKTIEDIRDILAHSENYPLQHLRLREILTGQSRLLDDVVSNDYPNLLRELEKYQIALEDSTLNWEVLKGIYGTISENYISIVKFLKYLNSRLSNEEKKLLIGTLDRRQQVEVDKIDALETELLSSLKGEFSRPINKLRDEINGLPLPDLKKEELCEITNFFKNNGSSDQKNIEFIEKTVSKLSGLNKDQSLEILGLIETSFFEKPMSLQDFEQSLNKLPLDSSTQRKIKIYYKRQNPDIISTLEKIDPQIREKISNVLFNEDRTIYQDCSSFKNELQSLSLAQSEIGKLSAAYQQRSYVKLSPDDFEEIGRLISHLRNGIPAILKILGELKDIKTVLQTTSEYRESLIEQLPLDQHSRQTLQKKYNALDKNLLIEGKRKEVERIIKELKTYSREENAQLKAKEIIDILSDSEKSFITERIFKDTLCYLGIQIDDREKWMEHYLKIVDIQNLAQSPEEDKSAFSLVGSLPEQNEYGKSLKRIKYSSQSILSILNTLEEITSGFRSYKDQDFLKKYSNNDILYYASEYITSSFRSQSSILESNLNFLKEYQVDYFQSFNVIYDRLSSTLSHLISHGKNIFHLHDVTQFNTVTEFGRRFYLLNDLIAYLDGIPLGESKRRFSSLIDNLNLCLVHAKALENK